MNITEDLHQLEILSIQSQLDEIYTQYYNIEEDNKSKRRELRDKWKELIKKHHLLTGTEIYRKNL